MTVRASAGLLLAAAAMHAPAQVPRARIAFLSDSGIVVINDDGSDAKRIVTRAATPPTWSPDGCSLVYRHGLAEFYVVTLDGKPEQLVARINGDNPENDLRSLFSPDGSQILISKSDAHFLVPARGDGVADFTGRPAPLFTGYDPVWSPDGKRIAFELRNTIHVINADGTGDITLGPGRAPAWTQGGSRVTFLTQEGSGNEPSLAIFKPNGAPQITMTLRVKMPFIVAIAWSPDASKAAFIGLEEDSKIAAYSLYVMNADGTGFKRLDDWLPFFMSRSMLPPPSWSPDGKRLVFSRSASAPGPMGAPSYDIYAINADGTGLTRLTHGGNNQTPVWSPIPKCK